MKGEVEVRKLWQRLDDWHKAFILSFLGSIFLFFIFLLIIFLGGLP